MAMRPLTALLLAYCVAVPAAAQVTAVPPVDSTAVVALRLTDGSEFVGRVVAVDDSSLTLLTLAAARVMLPRRSIASWRVRRGVTTARGFQAADPNTTRLFFGPTARTLPQGSGYFADYFLFFAVVGYGVHDRLMLSGGVSLVPGASNQLVYVAAKAGLVRSPTFAFALGGVWGTVPGVAGASLGSGYGVATFGTEDHAVTLLGGYPFTAAKVASEPLFMLGGETRLGSRSKLLAEFWKFPATDQVPVNFGVRWFGDRIAVDFGFIYVFGTNPQGWPFFPWVDFAVNF
jgi:hypothetical protein